MVIDNSDPVTITGLGGRFPKSWDVDEFWFNLLTGTQLCTESDERWPVGKFLGFVLLSTCSGDQQFAIWSHGHFLTSCINILETNGHKSIYLCLQVT